MKVTWIRTLSAWLFTLSDQGEESVGRNRVPSTERKEQTFPRMGLFRMRTGPTGRKLPPEGNSSCYRGLGMEGVGVGSTSKSCFTWRSALTACRWLLQMLLDPSKSVIKPWLFCQIATSSWLRLEKQQTNVISASPCSCCPSQKDHRKQSVFLWEPISWEG